MCPLTFANLNLKLNFGQEKTVQFGCRLAFSLATNKSKLAFSKRVSKSWILPFGNFGNMTLKCNIDRQSQHFVSLCGMLMSTVLYFNFL